MLGDRYGLVVLRRYTDEDKKSMECTAHALECIAWETPMGCRSFLPPLYDP